MTARLPICRGKHQQQQNQLTFRRHQNPDDHNIKIITIDNCTKKSDNGSGRPEGTSSNCWSRVAAE
jgi:hypothetical protein